MFTPPVTSGPDVVAPVRSAHSLLVPPWSAGGVAIGVGKLAVTRPVPRVRLCASSWAGGIFHRCQERRYDVGDCIRARLGQVMIPLNTRAHPVILSRLIY